MSWFAQQSFWGWFGCRRPVVTRRLRCIDRSENVSEIQEEEDVSALSEDDVATHWNNNADQWASDVRSGYDVYRDHFTLPAFLDFLPSISGLDVIDFGCGEGSNTRRFASMGARMTGIDLSERMIGCRVARDFDPHFHFALTQLGKANHLKQFIILSFCWILVKRKTGLNHHGNQHR